MVRTVDILTVLAIALPAAIAHAGGVISIDPPTSIANIGDTITVEVQMDTGTQPINAAQIGLDFDPAILQVQSLDYDASALLPLLVEQKFDNAAGTIDVAAFTLSNFPSGAFSFATVRFLAIGGTLGTPLNFATQGGHTSGCAFDAGQSWCTSLEGGTVIVEGPLVATVTPTPTTSPTPSATTTLTATATATNTPAATATAQPTLGTCVGDCNADGIVSAAEINMVIDEIFEGGTHCHVHNPTSAADILRAVMAAAEGC